MADIDADEIEGLYFYAQIENVAFKATTKDVLQEIKKLHIEHPGPIDVELERSRKPGFYHSGRGYVRFTTLEARDAFLRACETRKVVIMRRHLRATAVLRPRKGYFMQLVAPDMYSLTKVSFVQFISGSQVVVRELKPWTDSKIRINRTRQVIQLMKNPDVSHTFIMAQGGEFDLMEWSFRDFFSGIMLVKLPGSASPFQLMFFIRRPPKAFHRPYSPSHGFESEGTRLAAEDLAGEHAILANSQAFIVDFKAFASSPYKILTDSGRRTLSETLNDLYKYGIRMAHPSHIFELQTALPSYPGLKKAKHALPFSVQYALKVLLSTKVMSRAQLNLDIINFLQTLPPSLAVTILEKAAVHTHKPRRTDILEWLQKLAATMHDNHDRTLPEGMAWVPRIVITPLRRIYLPAVAEQANRVLRHFGKQNVRLIRVSFQDEDMKQLHGLHAPEESILKRVHKVLYKGIGVCGRRFHFLAFSSSQLREKTCWMVSSNKYTADDIRKWMGDFKGITTAAKYGARLGQSFSTTVVGAENVEIVEIDDITNGTKYCFTDGCGKISQALLDKVLERVDKRNYKPTGLQIRIGGFKGMVSLDPTLEGEVLHLRKSMKKFESPHRSLEVVGFTGPLQGYLNRQIIMLLEYLNIPHSTFIKLQERQINEMREMLQNNVKAAKLLKVYAETPLYLLVSKALEVGALKLEEPFVNNVITLLQIKLLHELTVKARIRVPNARIMKGVCDETNTLNYGEVFIQYTSLLTGERTILKDVNVIVVKNPCLYPGDILRLKAVDVPALHHHYDELVFPTKGPRPHPNETAGSDLDGDDYFVCWDPQLVPEYTIPPMDFEPPAPVLLIEPTIENVINFFVDYMKSEHLGVIANAHLAFADSEGLMSEKCIRLAQLHSIAVDFPKTGVPALMEPNLRPQRYPDFMEKKNEEVYESQKILGILYRQARDVVLQSRKGVTLNVESHKYWRESFDGIVLDEDFAKAAEMSPISPETETQIQQLLDEYAGEITALMQRYGINNESEVITGCIINSLKAFKKKKAAFMKDLRTNVLAAYNEIARNYSRQWWAEFFSHPAPAAAAAAVVDDEKQNTSVEDLEARVIAKAVHTYCRTYEYAQERANNNIPVESTFYWHEFEAGEELVENVEQPLLSFVWTVCGEVLVEYKKKLKGMEYNLKQLIRETGSHFGFV